MEFIVAASDIDRREKLFPAVGMKPPGEELDPLLWCRYVEARHLLDQLLKLH